MNKIHHITPHIPYLRRYARALTGSQASGDSYVAAGHCQIKATEFEKSHEPAISGRQLTPFGKRGGTVQLEGPAVVKMTFLVEVIVKR